MGLASRLALAFGWLCAVIMSAFMMLMLICVGPITSIIGYRGIVDRLTSDDPKHPLLQGTWEMRTAARQTKIVNAYIEKYGMDRNVGMAVAGVTGSLLAWYLSGYPGRWLMNLLG